jgi:hypothetical protein
MRPQSQFTYRIHSRLDTSLVLGGTIYIANGIGTTLLAANSLGALNAWRVVENPKKTLYFTMLPTEEGYDNAFLSWITDGNNQLWMGDTIHTPGGMTVDSSMFYFEDADSNWPNDPNNRTPDGTGWMKIHSTDGRVLDASGGGKAASVVTAGSWNGGTSQQWWPERIG